MALGHSAIAESATPSQFQPFSNVQRQPTLLIAQAAPPVPPEASPESSEASAQGEPEREIEFTSPSFTLGVQGENTLPNEVQGEPALGEGGPGETAQEPLEAGAQQDATIFNQAEAEALAAEHEWVEFSVEDSDEAIARYGCDDLYCINALREQRGLPPLQLVWDAQNSNGSPQ